MDDKIKIFVLRTDGIKTFRLSKEKIKAEGNLIKALPINLNKVKRIFSVRKNYMGKLYCELHYSETFEYWRSAKKRIERTNDEGYRDYTGYGCRTEGKKNRFYIGKSTGWLPIYLEILRKDSTGGGALSWKHGTLKPIN